MFHDYVLFIKFQFQTRFNKILVRQFQFTLRNPVVVPRVSVLSKLKTNQVAPYKELAGNNPPSAFLVQNIMLLQVENPKQFFFFF